MQPSKIIFGQDDVGNKIDTGNGERKLIDVFEDLVSGRLNAERIAPIEVVSHQGQIHAHDGNRRLLMFKVRYAVEALKKSSEKQPAEI